MVEVGVNLLGELTKNRAEDQTLDHTRAEPLIGWLKGVIKRLG